MDGTAQLALVIVFGILVFACLFKPEVQKKLADLRSFTFPGGSADLTGEQASKRIEEQNKVPEVSGQLPSPQEQPSGLPTFPPPNPVYLPVESDLRRRIEEALPGSIDAQMSWALRVAAVAQVERDHEQTYRIIFGSQMLALKELNVRGPMTVAQIRDEIYSLAMKAYPDVFTAETFEGWARFVLNRGLVALSDPAHAANENTRVGLSPLGRDFLIFVTARGLPENRWG